jgi:hypothetical protein
MAPLAQESIDRLVSAPKAPPAKKKKFGVF